MGLEVLLGPARVLDLTGVETEVTAADLVAAGLGDEQRVLLKTRNSAGRAAGDARSRTFGSGSPPTPPSCWSSGASSWSGSTSSRSTARAATQTWDTHLVLCPVPVAIAECVDLREVEAGVYELASACR